MPQTLTQKSRAPTAGTGDGQGPRRRGGIPLSESCLPNQRHAVFPRFRDPGQDDLEEASPKLDWERCAGGPPAPVTSIFIWVGSGRLSIIARPPANAEAPACQSTLLCWPPPEQHGYPGSGHGGPTAATTTRFRHEHSPHCLALLGLGFHNRDGRLRPCCNLRPISGLSSVLRWSLAKGRVLSLS